ncbi:beta-glucosidase [Nocardioides sp. JQ2195]|uniref:GH1 family beta-glucosidase n=1 Tax=Nocardioides sp. JQ2195 TaxID=2592334 RepID=UPI00143E8658|nr:GH1 family beta-glucosidase [Nocardioides sp. JQ2195]QIX28354.1 beta-glucosidase [Nocardioides sp. JQ2195]
MSIDLPPTFRFGASTAAYQIEGAVTAGGRGPSIWDTFCAEPGRIVDGSSGEQACDHYHRYAEDVALLKGLGVDGYRLSIAWPRIRPTGSGAVNAEGVAFYDRVLDELLEAGIEPMATLYHWDLPQALEDAGGWLARETAERFGEYAAICAERFGDRVAQWVPVNEPNVASLMGYALGIDAPGKALMFDALPAAHHLLLAHGRGAQALRAGGAKQVGCANNHAPMWTASDSDGDLAATGLFDDLWNNLFADPMLTGAHPEDLAPFFADQPEDDLAVINQPLDFYGVNYYNPYLVAAAAEGSEMPFDHRDIEGYPTTDLNWPVVPDGLREQLVTLDRRYDDLPPVVITESGCSYNVGPDVDGVVDDQPRIDYLDSHLRAVAAAIDEGVDVRGYFTWSLIDNFEWSEGYTQRFGLVHVDYETQKRTTKKSYDWFAAVIAANRKARP